MADNAYNIGTKNLFERLLSPLYSLKSAIVDNYFTPVEKLCSEDRVESDLFFKREKEFEKAFDTVGSQAGSISLERQLHMIATLEQDHKARYSCSRRHALTTTANNCNRLYNDIVKIY